MAAGSEKGTPTKRRVLIVDANPLVRRGLTALINGETDLAVGAEAATAQGALDAIAAVRPALVLADFSFEDSLGLDLVREIRARHLHQPVLLMSMDDAPVYAECAFHAGANGCVSKRELDETILTAIRAVLNGRGPAIFRASAGYVRQNKKAVGEATGLLNEAAAVGLPPRRELWTGSMYHRVERRMTPRHRSTAAGVVVLEGGFHVECIVRDFSTAGAGLSLPEAIVLGDEFDLNWNHAKRHCISVWRHLDRMGVKFGSWRHH
jgi:DNA-binding NarL/FixJ family response regulator